jgi:hypothetical protein
VTANYALKTEAVELGGKPIIIMAGATRDTVTDATLIALHAGNWTATAPVASQAVGITGVLAGWLAVYPRGEVH